ncbi:MAG: prolyl oligopeptidase family serine peptidase [Rikenellaceae bacterium]|jgi:prolyl oligopeptidase|nr:prolyl oligopeptidase family serine peptidase [Rikenellaceae bacterium]
MRKLLLTAAVAALTACGNNMNIKHLPYPVARMDSSVADDYFGTRVDDPYRWMEDDNSAETAAWVEAERAVTADYLSKIPWREAVRSRLTELYNYEKYGIPTAVGPYYFFSKNDGLQNQGVIYRQKGLDGQPEVFLDPNALSTEGTVALVSRTFSDDGKYMAYSLSSAGSDWVEIKVMDCETGQTLSDEIEWVKFSGASWAADSRGFYYSRYDKPAEGTELSGQNRFQKIYYHKLGDAQQDDRFVYGDPANPLRYFYAQESTDGKYLFVTCEEGTHGAEVLCAPAKSAAPTTFKTLFKGFENDYALVDCTGDRALFLTNASAPNFRLVAVNMRRPEVIADVIPEDPARLLEGVDAVGGCLIASYLRDAQNVVEQYNFKGEKMRSVELPGLGTVGGFGGKPEAKETFYMLTNFITPPTVYRYSLGDGTSSVFTQSAVPYDPTQFTVDQIFYLSKDSTRVPMFIVHRKDMELDGSHPCYLYGYGGFNNSVTPAFRPEVIMLLEQGGIYAVANIRGGGEYGEKWHHAGMLDKKQNVFDDFIAAAEYLIAGRYTCSSKLAIAGGSNGGLLVGACMTQRPELFAVALPAVGVMDMLRYHKFTVGWGWAVEYGSSDEAGQFPYLYKYSPLHNIKAGVHYPATLVTTGDHDDRVVPAHSFKFAATLQAAQGGEAPTLIRIDSNAGHGAGKPTSKRLDELTDVYSFFLWNTGVSFSR